MVSRPKSYQEFRETGPRGKVLFFLVNQMVFSITSIRQYHLETEPRIVSLSTILSLLLTFFGKTLEENKELEDICRQVIKLINPVLSTVDGGWGPWVEWSVCLSSCGLGTQTRFRYCDNPRPAYGGRACTGPRLDRRNCNRGSCPGIVYSSLLPTFKDDSTSAILVYL